MTNEEDEYSPIAKAMVLYDIQLIDDAILELEQKLAKLKKLRAKLTQSKPGKRSFETSFFHYQELNYLFEQCNNLEGEKTEKQIIIDFVRDKLTRNNEKPSVIERDMNKHYEAYRKALWRYRKNNEK